MDSWKSIIHLGQGRKKRNIDCNMLESNPSVKDYQECGSRQGNQEAGREVDFGEGNQMVYLYERLGRVQKIF